MIRVFECLYKNTDEMRESVELSISKIGKCLM